jgi:pilus assembly protein CpaE
MDKILTVIFSDEFSTSEVLKLYSSEIEGLDVCLTTNSEKTFEKLSNFDKKSVLIVDLSQNFNEKIELIKKISQECKHCSVLALSDNVSVEIIVSAMRSGAREFLPVPVIKTEFLNAMTKLITQCDLPVKSSNCKIISVFSNKGGLGKTSLATNLALELAKITKENIALIDLNFQTGDITTFLDLKPSFNISYMLENIDKINETFLLSTLERYKRTTLYVLADPPYFKQADDIKPQQITKLFNILRETFSYIIVDAEASFDGKNIASLDNSDLILLMTVANLPALRNTQRCLELFDKLGYDREKTKVVVNRFMENDEIKEEDVEKVLSRGIYWKVPNNYFAIMSAINKGIPVSEINSSTNVAQSYKKLALHIADNLYKINMREKFEEILDK